MGWKLPKPEAPAISVGSGLSARPPRDLHWRAAETLLRPMRRHTGVHFMNMPRQPHEQFGREAIDEQCLLLCRDIDLSQHHHHLVK